MRATDMLEVEHRRIGKVAEACAIFADELQQGVKIPAIVLRALADFLRLYAEQYHGEEEKWLYALLKQKGVPAGNCPMAILNYEGDKLQVLIEQLTMAVNIYSKADGAVIGTLVETLRSLAAIYRDHLWKEDYLLLPMANKILSETDQQLLAETFQSMGGEAVEDAQRSMRELSAAIKACSLCSTEEAA